MKLRLIAAGCLLAALNLASCADKKPHRPNGAGPGAGGMGNPQQNAEKMANDLGLSDEQKKSFVAAMKEHGQKMKALRDKTSLSEDERNKQTAAARQQLQKRMHSILTQDQFAKWQQERQAMHPPGTQGTPGGPTGPGGAGGPPPGPNGGYPPNGQPNRYLNGPETGGPPSKGINLGGDEPPPALTPLPPVNPGN
jgi:hypothetical protein